jgi:hypothetical protein
MAAKILNLEEKRPKSERKMQKTIIFLKKKP